MAFSKLKFLILSSALAGTFAAFPAAAYPFDFTPDPSRVVSDPSYLPLQGQVYGMTDYHFESLKSQQYIEGAHIDSYSYHAQDINQLLEYGIMDDLTIRAQGTYVPEAKKDYTSGPEYSFDGFEDPTFTAIWRALDQRTYPVSVDIGASYSPDVVNDRYATTTSSGSVGRGGQEAGAGVSVSYKTRSFTVQGNGNATYYGHTAYEQTDDVDGHSSSYWGYSFGLQTQTRITSDFSFNAGYTYTASNDENFTGSAGVQHTEERDGTHDFNAALNYQIIPNRLVAGLTYDYYIFGDTNDTYLSDPSLNAQTKNETENLFGVRLQYVFF